jgi:flagellar protein FliL
MATAPKAVPKVVPAEAGAPAAPEKKSKTKLLIIVGALVFLLGSGGVAAWLVLGGKGDHEGAAKPKHEAPAKPPVFLPMDPFTVNLQRENGDQYLQVAFTLQLADEHQVEHMKLYMPLLRSRILLLLSTKKASELESAEGKQKLQEEIVTLLKQPVTPNAGSHGSEHGSEHGTSQPAPGVFFTSFMIQ